MTVRILDGDVLAASEFELYDRRKIHGLETVSVFGSCIGEPCVNRVIYWNFQTALAWGPPGGGTEYWHIGAPVEDRLGGDTGILEADGPWENPGGCRLDLHQRLTIRYKFEGLTRLSRQWGRKDWASCQLCQVVQFVRYILVTLLKQSQIASRNVVYQTSSGGVY